MAKFCTPAAEQPILGQAPRPLRIERIEYKNAICHVMNRGRDRQFIFHDDEYYHAFLETLG